MRLSLFWAVLSFAFQAQAFSQNTFVLYQSCRNAGGDAIQLYADNLDGAQRPGVLTLFGFAYLGTANRNLTAFVSNDGRLRVAFRLDQSGLTVGALAIGPGFQRTFGQCFRTDDGGGSVSVHN